MMSLIPCARPAIAPGADAARSDLNNHMFSSGSPLPELLGEPDENSFRAPDVAEPVPILVLDHVPDECRAAFAEPGERIVDVLYREHDAQVTESVHRGATVIGNHRRRKELGHLEPAVAVRRTHHGDLDPHAAQTSDAIRPVTFDWGAPHELEAKFGEKLNGGIEVLHDDADVVHALDRHHLPLGTHNPAWAPRAEHLPPTLKVNTAYMRRKTACGRDIELRLEISHHA